MATIYIDGKQYQVDGASNLLQACLSLGLDIPYFCWHPALGSVGACRQCAVKQYTDANDKRGRLVMSCMTGATDGTYISIADDEAKSFRESVIEWLMTNHPHDCPVCEEGGHCHLQDMTVMTAHASRRYRFTKRTHQNQFLGPFVKHEMNRCIACYRCVRYYKDYAGGEDLGVYGARENVYFGRASEGVLDSEFSGNLVEVCPTGVFTDKTHAERYNRKWDMQFAPSICQQCSVGCNTSPGERYGELRRIENRYNGEVNHYFLCDRGRFGYGYVNRKDRPRQPWARQDDQIKTLTIDAALEEVGQLLKSAKRILGIGSPRASLEANFALQQLVGTKNFFNGMNEAELVLTRLALSILQNSAATIPSLRQIETKDAVLVLGEDVTQTAPRIALALRQAVKIKSQQLAAEKNISSWHAEAVADIGQQDKSPLFIASVTTTRLDDAATATYRNAPDNIARLGFAVAHAIDTSAPAVTDLDAITLQSAQQMATALMAAEQPLVVAGTGLMHTACLQAAANIVTALKNKGKAAAISLVVQETNSLGTAMMQGESVQAALNLLKTGAADAVVVIENDLYRRADTELVDAAFVAAKTKIVIDHQKTPTLDKADYVLAAASFAEGDGTVVNQEGRAQRFFQVYDPVYYEPECKIRESWRWLHALHSVMLNQVVSWTRLDEVTAACADAYPALVAICKAAPDASYRIVGRKLARQPHRYSGRTAMRANLSVHEPRTSQDVDSALTFSMEGYSGPKDDSALIPFAWAPGWNSPQSWNKFQDEVGGHLRSGDPGVRLITSAAENKPYYSAIPLAFTQSGEWTWIPLYHLYGSEELSVLAEAVATQIPEAYIAVATADAARLQLLDGQTISIKLGHKNLKVLVKIDNHLIKGMAGLPVGIAGITLADINAKVQQVTA